jgi:hypothetical protein
MICTSKTLNSKTLNNEKEKSDTHLELVSRKAPASSRTLEFPVRIAFCFAGLRVSRRDIKCLEPV